MGSGAGSEDGGPGRPSSESTQRPAHSSPGWQPDPWKQARLRWWDGRQWTGHVHPPPPLPGPTKRVATITGGVGTFSGSLGTEGSFAGWPGESERARAVAEAQFERVPAGAGASTEPTRTAVLALWAVLFFGGLVLLLAAAIWWGLAAALFAIAAVVLWRRYWLLADTPTMEVAGAHPGLCELAGRARPVGAPVTSWFTGRPCIWYRAELRTGKTTSWWRQDGSEEFLLVDDTGEARVNLSGTMAKGGRFLAASSVEHEGRTYHLTEWGLPVDDRLFVLGPVAQSAEGRTIVGREKRRHRRAGADLLRPPFEVTHTHEDRQQGLLRVAAVAASSLAGALVFLNLPIPLGIVVVASGATAGYLWRLYNRLVTAKHRAEFAWSLIETSAVQRHDLIGNLAHVAATASSHEKDLLEAGSAARAHLPSSQERRSVEQLVADDTVERARVAARAEAHPTLGAGPTFEALSAQLVSIENRLAAHRRYYNDAVTVLHDLGGTFPGVVLRPLAVRGEEPALLDLDLGDHRGRPATGD